MSQPPNNKGYRPPQPPGPETKATVGDARQRFAKATEASRKGTPPPDFIEGKIGMVRSDPGLTDAQKAAAIRDLERRRSK